MRFSGELQNMNTGYLLEVIKRAAISRLMTNNLTLQAVFDEEIRDKSLNHGSLTWRAAVQLLLNIFI